MGQRSPNEVGTRLPRAYDERSIILHLKSQSDGFLCTRNCYGRGGEFSVSPFFCENDGFLQFAGNNELVGDEKKPGHFVSELEGPAEAGERLCRFIDEHHLLDPESGPRRPLVVLAFDEADTLTDNPPNNDWNLFFELRSILRQITELPIFSLFLSTAGRYEKITPVIRYNPSARARDPDNRPLDPISEISFDDIAYPASKGTITIHNTVSIDWISHLGRPLYVHPSYPSRELLSYHLE